MGRGPVHSGRSSNRGCDAEEISLFDPRRVKVMTAIVPHTKGAVRPPDLLRERASSFTSMRKACKNWCGMAPSVSQTILSRPSPTAIFRKGVVCAA